MKKKTTHYSKQAAYKLPNNADSIDVRHQRCLRSDLDIPIAERTRKKYFSLAALFALHGLELVKGDPEIRGQAPYYLVKHTTCVVEQAKNALKLLLPRKHCDSLNDAQKMTLCNCFDCRPPMHCCHPNAD